MAQSRLKSQGLRSGSLEAAKELSQVTGYLRRRLSTATVRANVKCLLERLVLVGKLTSVGSGQGQKRQGPGGSGRPTGKQGCQAGPFLGEEISSPYELTTLIYN